MIELDDFAKFRFIMRVLDNGSHPPEQDRKAARDMTLDLFKKWHSRELLLPKEPSL